MLPKPLANWLQITAKVKNVEMDNFGPALTSYACWSNQLISPRCKNCKINAISTQSLRVIPRCRWANSIADSSLAKVRSNAWGNSLLSCFAQLSQGPRSPGTPPNPKDSFCSYIQLSKLSCNRCQEAKPRVIPSENCCKSASAWANCCNAFDNCCSCCKFSGYFWLGSVTRKNTARRSSAADVVISVIAKAIASVALFCSCQRCHWLWMVLMALKLRVALAFLSSSFSLSTWFWRAFRRSLKTSSKTSPVPEVIPLSSIWYTCSTELILPLRVVSTISSIKAR